MKRAIAVCTALLLALAPAGAAEAAKGGKSKRAATTCVAKTTVKGKVKKAKKAKKARKAGKVCFGAKKVEKAKQAPAATSGAALAQRDCRDDQRLDPEAFAADFGAGADALERCAAEMLGRTGDDEVPEDEPPADDHEPV